jgi:hypothetical protein
MKKVTDVKISTDQKRASWSESKHRLHDFSAVGEDTWLLPTDFRQNP